MCTFAVLFSHWVTGYFFEDILDIFIYKCSIKMFYTENPDSKLLYLTLLVIQAPWQFWNVQFLLVKYFRHFDYIALVINVSKH